MKGRRHEWLLVPVATLCLAAACGGDTSGTSQAAVVSTTLASPSTSTLTTPPGPATSPVPTRATTTSASPRPATTVSISEADNGRTVTVRRGDGVTAVLRSTYWSFVAPSDSVVLEPRGPSAVAPELHGCVPGQGCGTVTARYLAAATGQSQVSAHRDTCGEAMACGADQRDWRVTVTVAT